MKTLHFFSATLLTISLLFLSIACTPSSGEVGPQGPAGPQGVAGPVGPQGPAGQNGNANVIQITFGSRTHTGSDISYSLTNINASIINNAAYFTYVNPNGNWYSLPGTTDSGLREYRTYISPGSNSTLYVKRVAGTGSETFTSTRVVIIPASELRNGRKAAIDYSNYEEVKKAYNLAD